MPASSPTPEKPAHRSSDARSRFPIFAGKMPFFHSGVFWAATPALALFALAALTAKVPLPRPIGSTASSHSGIISASDWVVAASETILVTRQSAGKYSVLRGRLAASKGDAITAPSGGVVTQVSVHSGQTVRLGQQVAVLSTGVVPAESLAQAPSPMENLQSRAENAQVAAAQQQEKLESRMNAANTELQRAKERVATAQQRVADARRLIARLQNGEQIAADEAPAAPVRSTPKRETNSAANVAARRESQRLQSAAESTEAAVKDAQKSARDAADDADAKQQKLKSVLANSKTAAKTKSAPSTAAGSTPSASGADNSADSKTPKERASNDDAASSAAVSSAREIAASAAAHALDLKREAVRQQTRATQARSKANDAARRATQDLQVFEDANQAAPAPQRKAPTVKSGGSKMTVAQATRIAQAAMKESDAAIKNAERIQQKVEGYNRPVATTRRKFNQAAQQLEVAQQRMWDRAPTMHTKPTPIAAQRSGVVTWVAAPSTVIHTGEAVASVGRPDRLEVVVEDKTGAWKTLKPNARVLALVQRETTAAKNANDEAGSTPRVRRAKPRPIAAMTRGSEGDINIPTLARVLFVAPPSKPGQAARIRIAVHNPPANGNNANGLSPRVFAPGMPVFFSVAQQSKQTAIRIPTAAVRRAENGKTYVAVLAPIENPAQDHLANQCRVEWREVFLAPGDGISNRVKLGLKEGERLALRPNALYDYTLAFGPKATVSVEQI